MQEKPTAKPRPKYYITDQVWAQGVGFFDLIVGLVVGMLVIYGLVDDSKWFLYTIKNITFGCKQTPEKSDSSMEIDTIFILKAVAGTFGLFVYLGLSVFLMIAANKKNIQNCKFWFRIHAAALISQSTLLFISMTQRDTDCMIMGMAYLMYRVFGIFAVKDFYEELERLEAQAKAKPLVDNNDRV